MKRLYALLLSFVLVLSGCSVSVQNLNSIPEQVIETTTSDTESEINIESVSLENIPEYSGTPYIEINNNIPYFTEKDLTTESYESYSELDSLGRCGVAMACIGQDLMPTEDRESISAVKPSGSINNQYSTAPADRAYLYTPCHPPGFPLAGENANEKNLITGTRYMNVDGMLPFENMVADYVKETNNHVLYRITPIYDGNNLVASGILMEAESVEDDEILFNVYCYNVQPGITIDYVTGDNWEDSSYIQQTTKVSNEKISYILNTNTMKFHNPDCASVDDMNPDNKEEFYGTRDELINNGYSPCGNCKP